MALKLAGNVHIGVTARDVKEMWKACNEAKKGGERTNYEATVQKVVERAIGQTISKEDAKEISKKVEPSLQEYGKALKSAIEDRIFKAFRIAGGLILLAGAVVCVIGGKELLQEGDGPRAFAAWFVGVPACGLLGTVNIVNTLMHWREGAEKIADAAHNVVWQAREAIREGAGLK